MNEPRDQFQDTSFLSSKMNSAGSENPVGPYVAPTRAAASPVGDAPHSAPSARLLELEDELVQRPAPGDALQGCPYLERLALDLNA